MVEEVSLTDMEFEMFDRQDLNDAAVFIAEQCTSADILGCDPVYISTSEKVVVALFVKQVIWDFWHNRQTTFDTEHIAPTLQKICQEIGYDDDYKDQSDILAICTVFITAFRKFVRALKYSRLSDDEKLFDISQDESIRFDVNMYRNSKIFLTKNPGSILLESQSRKDKNAYVVSRYFWESF